MSDVRPEEFDELPWEQYEHTSEREFHLLARISDLYMENQRLREQLAMQGGEPKADEFDELWELRAALARANAENLAWRNRAKHLLLQQRLRMLHALEEMAEGVALPHIFKAWVGEKVYAVPPDRLVGIFEAICDKFKGMHNWKPVERLERERTDWIRSAGTYMDRCIKLQDLVLTLEERERLALRWIDHLLLLRHKLGLIRLERDPEPDDWRRFEEGLAVLDHLRQPGGLLENRGRNPRRT